MYRSDFVFWSGSQFFPVYLGRNLHKCVRALSSGCDSSRLWLTNTTKNSTAASKNVVTLSNTELSINTI